ncbi:CAP domain-containing protein [Halolamina salifodinae]|uniref:Uncharacterized protein YkwD n=1 Tax=Halolamina salifodinae TaxID=1202767 RepID=A0A8T4GYL0_9EURY|nr:CAP domain-containing protein [Halolamina salifodinae]MBP1987223.1 uncharacterized protein YkwD [Halolamina salifodinae]
MWRKLLSVVIVAVLVAGAVGFVAANPGTVPSMDLSFGGDDELDEENVEQLLHEEINDYRANQSVGRLEYDDDLAEIADYHSAQMAEDGDIYHTSPSGETVEDRYERFGYDCRVPEGDGRYRTSGENVAQTWYQEELTNGDYYSTPEELAEGIAQQLINSPEHRENLVDDVWRAQGIGINITEQNGNTAVYVTQNFC